MGNTQLNICWWHSSPPPRSPLLCCVSSKWNYDNFHTGDNQLEREHRPQHTTNFFFHVSINWKLEVKYSISFYLHFLTLFISSVYSIQKCQWADDHHQFMRTSAGIILVSRCLASVDIFAGLSFRWRGQQCGHWRCWHREHDHTTLYQHWPGPRSTLATPGTSATPPHRTGPQLISTNHLHTIDIYTPPSSVSDVTHI